MNLLSYLVIAWLYLPYTSSDRAHCEVMSFETAITIEPDGKKIVSKDISIVVNDRAGEWITERSIWYNGKKNRVLSLEAQIIDRNGEVVKTLKKKNITDRSAIGGVAWYTDDFIKEFQLLHHKYPYQLKFSYKQKFDEYLDIEDWDPYLYYSVPTRYAKLEVTNHSDIELYIWESDSSITKTQVSKVQTKWEINNAPKLKEEILAPPLYEQSPRVIIRPNRFSYGSIGSNDSWQSFGDWSLALQQNCNDLSLSDQESIRALVANMDNDHDKIKAIYNQMQDEVRYIYVGVEYGGLQSYPASYVSDNKFGDCKALTTYMQSALAAVNIPSYRTTVYAGDDPIKVIDSLPSHQSNHVILCIPLERDTVWLENTSNINPYNYLGSFTQNRKALLMKPSGSQLVDLPSFDMKSVTSYRIFNLELVDDKLQGNVQGQYRGEKYDELISFEYQLSDTEKRNALKKYSPSYSSFEIERADRNQKFVNINTEMSLDNKVKSYGVNKAVFIPNSNLVNLEKPEKRTSELRIRIPENLTDSIYFNIDTQQYTQIELPADTLLSIVNYPDCQYSLSFSQSEGAILCIRKLQYPIYTFDVGQPFVDFYTFIDDIKNIERKTYIKLKP